MCTNTRTLFFSPIQKTRWYTIKPLLKGDCNKMSARHVFPNRSLRKLTQHLMFNLTLFLSHQMVPIFFQSSLNRVYVSFDLFIYPTIPLQKWPTWKEYPRQKSLWRDITLKLVSWGWLGARIMSLVWDCAIENSTLE